MTVYLVYQKPPLEDPWINSIHSTQESAEEKIRGLARKHPEQSHWFTPWVVVNILGPVVSEGV